MKQVYRVMVSRHGFAAIAAESEADALEKLKTLNESDFDWEGDGYQDDGEVVEVIEDTKVSDYE